MAYVAVKGGSHAIHEAEKLLKYIPWKEGGAPLEVQQIRKGMRLAVDRVMSEGSLYDPDLAALALKQAEGDVLEASFLLRAFRSTLVRNFYTLPIQTENMDVIRRISATFKEVPGGQYLGPTRDYTKRLLDMSRMDEDPSEILKYVTNYLSESLTEAVQEELSGNGESEMPVFPRVIELLRAEGLLAAGEPQDEEAVIDDITRHAISFPSSRSARLQTMARGESGALMAFAYSSVRGYGDVHPTIGELRVGYVPVEIEHPFYPGETMTIGRVLVTESEMVVRVHAENHREAAGRAQFAVGYGLCFGHNEDKAISMSILDQTMQQQNADSPAQDEEFVLYHIDGIESSGFISHFKLPHYVDFQAELQRVRSINEKGDRSADGEIEQEKEATLHGSL
ncbi:carbon-phosphorus lyase complex subunit PhnI [Paenibacillus terrigena]|uniref:carbon-phosphorus lyase complex subunit PhnI n=1 Tax=Paenibacillus terrigena TaxID=369333 RepID=UPI0028D448F0|nr:carbon-phosphorus lyase complex subunit PhnI [Paenibacillus terrigena]